MSLRPLIYPLSSIEPLRKALGGRDESLLDRMAAEYAAHHEVDAESTEVEEFRAEARSFIDGALHDSREPGEWDESLHMAARALGLLRSAYPINDDWKHLAWSDYDEYIGPRLPDKPRSLFHRLVEGRPLKGEGVKVFWNYYAWLEANEVEDLYDAIRALPVDEVSLGELLEFHEELREWLECCRGHALLLIAS